MGAPLLPGATVTVVYNAETPSSANSNNGPIVGNNQSEAEADSASGPVGQ
jgi:hypothetical protein